ncbi:MAG: hypothetical protein JXO44_14410 [Clostridia bacterium]|nr:hypothetical protein [Clostridia bacterium]
MKKLTSTLLLSSTLLMTTFAGGLTQYDLAELLVNKAQAEHRIESKIYTEDEVLSFVKDYNLYAVTDKGAEVGTDDVRKALSTYDTLKETIKVESEQGESNLTVAPVVEKNVVDQMIENAMAADMLQPISIEEFESQFNDDRIYSSGCYMENGEIHVAKANEVGLEEALVKILDVARVLAAHAEEHDMMIGIKGGGTGMYVMYGESWEALRQNNYMFKIGYKRHDDFSMNQGIDGVTYSFDREVVVNNLYAVRRIEDKLLESQGVEGLFAWSDIYIDMEEDILHAYYDALKVLDSDTAEALFEQSVSDYRYSKTHEYPNYSKNSLFKINEKTFYKEDVRSEGVHNYLEYSYMK